MAKKILIIDDDADYVASVEAVLKSNGYEVKSCLDGDNGFECAQKEKPDCVLLDVMMEHASEGLDIAKMLRDNAATSAIPVIIMTGIRKPELLTASYGADEVWNNIVGTLEKPVKPDGLLRMVEKAVSKK